ncbi:hypothetical protein E2C01_009687 [Portunus trituberculatus]|uniref:Uncharacterized protein n=1 Tax=Portunus trituberculatus TaxID=210409 RepID=A0A5B7D6F0_PORTR|nr:hypothetical protein [Portunus trituberculatus]
MSFLVITCVVVHFTDVEDLNRIPDHSVGDPEDCTRPAPLLASAAVPAWIIKGWGQAVAKALLVVESSSKASFHETHSIAY